MAIITFWNDIKGETGKTAAIAAVSTYLAINNNYKISYNFIFKYITTCFRPFN